MKFINAHLIFNGFKKKVRLQAGLEEYSALDTAKYFIKKATEESDVKLTPLKLQKLLYYAQGWYLANKNRPLFKDTIEAWKYGPAIPSIYRHFREYGSQPLFDKNIDISDTDEKIDDKTKKYLDKVWVVYKKYDGTDLVYTTHKEDPWIEAKSDTISSNDFIDYSISNDSIKSYFQKKINNG